MSSKGELIIILLLVIWIASLFCIHYYDEALYKDKLRKVDAPKPGVIIDKHNRTIISYYNGAFESNLTYYIVRVRVDGVIIPVGEDSTNRTLYDKVALGQNVLVKDNQIVSVL